jgi:hypothetical protein
MKVQRILRDVLTIVTLLTGAIAIYTFYVDKKPILDIKKFSSVNLTNEKLTDICTLNGLHAEYSYNKIPINSLWQLNYKIKNIGREAIKAKGRNTNIIGENINFYFQKNFKIIDLTKKTNDSISISISKNIITISFSQWLVDEEIDLTVWVEALEPRIIPKLSGNKKEFDNADIEYSSILSKKINIYDNIPKPLLIMIISFSIMIYILLLLTIIWMWTEQLLIYLSYRTWLKNNKSTYDSWIKKLVNANELKEYKEPKDLALRFWKKSPTLNRPTLLDKNIENILWGGTIIIVLSLFTLTLFYNYL